MCCGRVGNLPNWVLNRRRRLREREGGFACLLPLTVLHCLTGDRCLMTRRRRLENNIKIPGYLSSCRICCTANVVHRCKPYLDLRYSLMIPTAYPRNTSMVHTHHTSRYVVTVHVRPSDVLFQYGNFFRCRYVAPTEIGQG